MKAKSQGPISSELDAREKLIVYVYEYLTRTGAKRAAQAFLEDIQYDKSISFSTQDGNGFLFNWFVLFWDLYVSTKIHEPKQGNNNQVEPTSDARAFVEYHMRPVMSPHHQSSPPQPSPYMNPGPRGYGPPPNHSGVPMRHGPPPPMNVGPPRMQMGQPLPPPQMSGGPPPPMTHSHGHPMISMPNGPHSHGPPPPPLMMGGGAPSPRYATHPGHITPVSGGPEPGPSPGLVNRMTPNHGGSPHPHMVGGPPPGPPPPGTMHPGMPSHSPMSQPGPPGPPPPMQQRSGPGPSGWQGGYGSPAEQCFMPGPPGPSGQANDFGGMMMNDGTSMMEMKPPQAGANSVNNNSSNNNTPANAQQDDYVLPGTYGQPSDQGGDEIRKLKESLESDEGDQTGFSMDYVDPQGKW